MVYVLEWIINDTHFIVVGDKESIFNILFSGFNPPIYRVRKAFESNVVSSEEFGFTTERGIWINHG